MDKKIIKKGDLFFPSQEFKEQANVSRKAIYKEALKNPVKFWEGLAKDIYWRKKWTKGFEHNPPYFKWFKGGKLNITESCLDKNLEKYKNKAALIWEPEPTGEKTRTLTYRELLREVNKFANALKRLGVKKGDIVGIYMPMLAEVIIAMLACARIGAVHSVVFSAFSSSALKTRLDDTGAKLLITADGYYRRGKIIDLKKSADIGVKGTKVKKIIVVKRANNKISFNKTKDLWLDELVAKESDECKPEIMDSEDLLFILYTSGSTGKPKGTMHTCGGYAVQAKWTGKWLFDWKENDIFWSTADIGWITGHTYSCYSPLLNGITFVIFEGSLDFPLPERWANIIEEYDVTIFYTAPTAVRMFEKYGTHLFKKYKFESLRLLGSVGEPIDTAAWQWYFKNIGKGRCLIVDTWWQTETGGILISSLPGIGPFKPSYTGLPFPGIRFDILDGKLVILPPFSPGLLRGIYKNPKRYLDTYWKEFGNKIYFTSDSAHKNKQGLIRIVGRLDDVLKVAGHRLTTGELESALSLHPDITESAVVGIPDKIKGETPIAFIVCKESKKSNATLEKEAIAQIRKEIGPIAGPKQVFVVDDLPKTRSGKIMRRILKKLFTKEPIGDLSTLANPQSVDRLKKIIAKKL